MGNIPVDTYLFDVLTTLANTAACGAAYEDNWSDEVAYIWKDAPFPTRKQFSRKVTIAELDSLPTTTLENLGFRVWPNNHWLLPLWVFNYIADGETLLSVKGRSVIKKGTNSIDLDIIGGCIAFGWIKLSTLTQDS